MNRKETIANITKAMEGLSALDGGALPEPLPKLLYNVSCMLIWYKAGLEAEFDEAAPAYCEPKPADDQGGAINTSGRFTNLPAAEYPDLPEALDRRPA